jgi:acetoin utilization deacetylase AcuC-like enzyme
MDLMTALAAGKDAIKVEPSVWPVTLTHMMGCGQLGIGMFLKIDMLIIAVDTTFDPEQSPKEAKLATGSLLNLCDAVVTGRVQNGFALIRPPGHHAEPGSSF